eukprot:SM000048S16563  [mRNA]  locus=s48:433463:435408:- [translate_table: standard]
MWLSPVGLAAEIERYSDKYKPKARVERAPLSSVLKLTPAHFPAQLLGPEAKRRKQAAPSTAQWRQHADSAVNDLQRLDRLATLEQKVEREDTEKSAATKDEKKAEEGDGDGEEGEGEEEEDEEEFGDDDYAQVGSLTDAKASATDALYWQSSCGIVAVGGLTAGHDHLFVRHSGLTMTRVTSMRTMGTMKVQSSRGRQKLVDVDGSCQGLDNQIVNAIVGLRSVALPACLPLAKKRRVLPNLQAQLWMVNCSFIKAQQFQEYLGNVTVYQRRDDEDLW